MSIYLEIMYTIIKHKNVKAKADQSSILSACGRHAAQSFWNAHASSEIPVLRDVDTITAARSIIITMKASTLTNNM